MERLTMDSTIQLRNGVTMPRFGFGAAEIASTLQEQTVILRNAIEVGYRLFDTAAMYHTELGVGNAVKESGIDRDAFFLSTKVWNGDARRGKKAIIRTFEESLRKLGTDYVDLLILHWPVQGHLLDTWKVMEDIYYSGRARALGLSNIRRFHHLEILQNCDLLAHVQQDSFNPRCRNLYNRFFCDSHEIVFEAFSPIERGAVSGIPELQAIAEHHGKTAIQVVLRWDLQSGVVTIPRTSVRAHMESNADIFDFELSDEEMGTINVLDREEDYNWDIDNFNF